VFQWSGADLEVAGKAGRMEEELAVVVIYCVYLADALDVDLANIVAEKIEANAAKYPVGKSKGSSHKYKEL
jgi:NTP pyrophosphatase (non-canonical NTP hydrolase)